MSRDATQKYLVAAVLVRPRELDSTRRRLRALAKHGPVMREVGLLSIAEISPLIALAAACQDVVSVIMFALWTRIRITSLNGDNKDGWC